MYLTKSKNWEFILYIFNFAWIKKIRESSGTSVKSIHCISLCFTLLSIKARVDTFGTLSHCLKVILINTYKHVQAVFIYHKNYKILYSILRQCNIKLLPVSWCWWWPYCTYRTTASYSHNCEITHKKEGLKDEPKQFPKEHTLRNEHHKTWHPNSVGL